MRTSRLQNRNSKSGFSLVELLIVVAIILIIGAIAIPNLIRSKMAANETSAVGSCRTITTAQATYASKHPKSGFACDLNTLGSVGYIDATLAAGSKSGYAFALLDCKRDKGLVVGYTWVANPTRPGESGVKFFCGDETGVIRFSSTDATDCLRNGHPLG